jgi:hypothetical protein
MPGVYLVKPASITSRDIIGDDETRLNRISSSTKSLVYKIGGTTQKYIEDRTRSYGDYDLVYDCDTSRESALYLEEYLRNKLIAIGYKQWRNKKDHFIIHHTDIDDFVSQVRIICTKCSKELRKMEDRVAMGGWSDDE